MQLNKIIKKYLFFIIYYQALLFAIYNNFYLIYLNIIG